MADSSKPKGRDQQQWVILIDGRQIGPFDEEEVVKKIQSDELLGEEKIKLYPNGSWKLLSQEAKFYDELINQLNQKTNRKADSVSEDTVAVVLKPDLVIEAPKSNSNMDIAAIFPQPPAVKRETSLPKASEVAAKPEKKPFLPKIEVGSSNSPKARNASIFLILVSCGIIAFLLFSDSNQKVNPKPSLLMVDTKIQERMSGEDQKAHFESANQDFFKDTYEGLWEAQKKLVHIIERAPQNIQARGQLCVVYKSLWPFVKQDPRDLATVQGALKAVKALDPVGINGVFCELSSLFVQGRLNDAKGVIDHALSQPGMDQSPVLYSFKAEVLVYEKDYKSAALFAGHASQISPLWLNPLFQQATYLAFTNDSATAKSKFEELLNLNPKHRSGKIEYGIFLFEKGDAEVKAQALGFLEDALKMSGVILRSEEARGYYVLAKAYSTSGNSKALTYAQNAYALNPADVASKNLLIELGGSPGKTIKKVQNNELVYLGDQFFRAGDYLSAQAEYAAAFDLDSSNAVAAKKTAEALWKINQATEAEVWLRKAIKSDPKYTTAYYLLADYLSSRYQYLPAFEVLNHGIKSQPQSFEIIRGFGLVEWRRNNLKEAIEFLEKANKLYPTDVETLTLLAKSYLAMGDLQKATNCALTASELDGTSAEARVVYAKIMAQTNGVDSAINFMKEQIGRFSYTTEYRLGLADIYSGAERYHEAKTIYEQVSFADTKNKKAFLGLGDAQKALGQTELALRTYLSTSVIDPSDPDPLMRAGLVFYETGRFKQAISQFERARTMNPVFPRLNYYMGKAAFADGNFELSLKAAGAEKGANPNLADSYILAGETYMALRDFMKAAEQFQEAIKRRPKGGELYVKIARCHIALGNLDVAESMLVIAANQESGLPEIYREQGIVFEKKQDPRSAVAAYNKYLSLAPNAYDRKDIESRIDKLSR